MKICPNCGKEWPDEFRLCPADGSSLPAGASATDLVDSIIADRYHVLKKLGAGGMGTVYLAEHVKMGQQAAIKVISRALASDPAAIARFTREARNAARIRHPNVCMIHDFGETPDGLIYMAMEYIEGEALADLLKREGRLSLNRAANILMQCCDALQAAHDLDIVHRDIKPENIMITKARDGSDVVKVVDFGIAKAVAGESGQTVTQTGFIVGTPDYMSPDQVSGEVLDGRSDIYSLAVVFFRMVTGALPFKADTPQDALLQKLAAEPIKLQDVLPAAGFTSELQGVLDRALAQRRDNRHATAIEFGKALIQAVRAEADSLPTVDDIAPTEKFETPQPQRLPPMPPTTAAARPKGTPETPQPVPSPGAGTRKGPKVAAALAGAVVVIGGAAVLWQVTSGGGPDTTGADSSLAATSDSVKTNGDKDDETAPTGTVAISGLPEGGTVLLGDEVLESPFQLPEGRHEVELRAPGYENKRLEIDVVAGERMTVMYAARRVQAARTQPTPPAPRADVRASARAVTIGQTVSGTLSANDRRVDNRHVQAWSLNARAGQQVDVTLRSSAFDAYLYLSGPGLPEQLENDDGGGGLNSRISATLPSNGTYTILASTLAEGATGAYTLSVTAPVSLGALPTTGRRLAMGRPASGSLGDADPTYEGRPVQAWELRVGAGTAVEITLRSSDFDTYLYVTGPGLAEPLVNDDGAGGTDSRVRATLQGGTYHVIASRYTGGPGAYSLSVAAPGAEAFPTNGRTLTVGQSASGALTTSDQSFGGRQVQAWALRVAAATRIEITLRSDAFDPYLYLAGPGLDQPLSNDDGADGNNSRITATLAGGTYYALAGAYSSGSTGPYAISVATPPGLQQLQTTGRVLSAGTSASGTLSSGDPVYEGRHVQLFELRGQAGARIQISLRSDAFDTYLYLVGPGLAEPITDDDGGEGTNSQVTATLPQSGTYLIGAAGFGEAAVGAYRIAVGVAR